MATAIAATSALGADQLRIYRLMLLTRALDDRVAALSHQGRVGISATARGHEAAQVASASVLRPGTDVVLPYYRDIGVALTLGITPQEILLGALDKAADPFSGAKQMPFHFTSPRLRMPTPSTSIATQIPHAVGAALACKLRHEDAVTVVYFGEGATSKGDFHEALSFAAIHRLPVIFFCENNQYAISVPVARQIPVAQVADRARGYGIPGERCDGMSVEDVYATTSRAVQRARRGEGPTLIEALVYRLGPHTSHDDDSRYRSRDEVAAWEAREPIARLRGELFGCGLLDETADRALVSDVRADIEAALRAAEAAAPPDRISAFRQVLADVTVPDPFADGRASGDRSARRTSSEGIGATGVGR
ncbi:MAG: thiamine pyrophosphate-dependent dehydrogenase E1 component subunit alpha [Chloroflexi bacterium]|nr:thiamine pyrophosphate-dependent dehydrogenase E1 component subunit alpha [Chloroflexota bacterium]